MEDRCNGMQGKQWCGHMTIPRYQFHRNPTGQVVIEESNKKIEEFRSKAPGMESSMCIFDRRAMIISCG
jgi:hypothetical protein